MGFFLTSFKLNLKKFASQKAILVGLILMLIILSIGGIALNTDTTVIEVTVGVYFDRENELETQVFEILETGETPFVRFVAYDTREALLEDVRLGRIECGYILHISQESVVRSELRESATVVISPRTVATPVLNEIVAAAILRATTQELTQAALEFFFDGNPDIAEFVAWQFGAYAKMDIFMTPEFAGQSYLAESAPDLFKITASRIFHGLIGLTIFILLLFCTPMFIKERRFGLPMALRAYGKLGTYYASLWAAAFVVSFSIGIAGLCAMAIFAPQLLATPFTELAALTGYAAVCSVLLVLFSYILRNASLIQSFGLFIIILNIFFGGILLDIAEVSPDLALIQRLFPLFWYVEAIIVDFIP